MPKRELAARAAVVLWAALVCGCRPGVPVAALRTSPSTIRLGYPESALLHFDWSPSTAIDRINGSPTVFVHLLDERGGVRRTFDHPFPRPWSPGRRVSYDVELYQSALGAALPPGSYAVSAGLYDPASGRRWVLETGATELGRREYRVGKVEVPAKGAAPAASFEFAGEWGPTEPDPSVQVLARRRLNGPSTLRFAGRPGVPGSVRLALTVHGAAISVESSCGPGAARRLEPGYQWIGFDLPASGSCDIQFPVPGRSSGPSPASLAGALPREEPVTSLDVAAWRPAAGY